ncbi:hypothetical protein E4O03_08725 [Treponema sp. OMZ 792]|uniref:hypothetical protein n=1 Tax=unclassified Treponema TaxID=2638727 RepID=UPI0020A4B78A|nr:MULTISPECIES: hypothetical protein [unclassified Treponema]UTC74324.1 hypothetical protein E4O03_08725 [Treponema sp. OMZ 792]UTC80721.1 hypothetical protein E4O07_08625 [Treponema sp. OMZ 798]
MKRILFFILLFFFLQDAYSENTVYELGPKSENIIVFTASRNQNNESTFSTDLLENFAKELKDVLFQTRVIIAITDNDFPELPESIDIIESQNTKKLISKINESKSSLVFVLSDGPSDRAVLSAGAVKKTSPSWMLKDLQEILQKQNIPVDFKYNNIILYRLGIIGDNMLTEYLKEDIPAIRISYGADIRPVLLSLINTYTQGISSEWDKHYNVKKIWGLRIISERTLVLLVIGVTLFALFYIFIFSFLFGRRREKNIRDLLLLWRVPIFFFIINLFALYIGEYLTTLMFSFKFGFQDSIKFLPVTAILLKLLFAAIIISLFAYVNRYLKLPNNIFIYGYLASIVCFFNIFIFSRVNLSLAILVLEIYILSFFSYHFQKLYAQILFLILNSLLLVYYFSDVLFIKDNLIDVLFYANNILAAMFILPYMLMFIRLFMQLKKERPMIKFMHLKIIGAITLITCVFVVLVLIYPPFLHLKNKKEFILYNIENENKYISLISNIKNKPERIDEDKEFYKLSGIREDDFIKVQAGTQNYLERVIGEVNINPLIKAAVIQVIISRTDGFPVYEANMDFKKSNEGKKAEFISPINLTEPFSIKFSGEKNAVLHVKILAWFYDNPLNPNFEFLNDNLKNKKMIFHVIKEFDLIPKTES